MPQNYDNWSFDPPVGPGAAPDELNQWFSRWRDASPGQENRVESFENAALGALPTSGGATIFNVTGTNPTGTINVVPWSLLDGNQCLQVNVTASGAGAQWTRTIGIDQGAAVPWTYVAFMQSALPTNNVGIMRARVVAAQNGAGWGIQTTGFFNLTNASTFTATTIPFYPGRIYQVLWTASAGTQTIYVYDAQGNQIGTASGACPTAYPEQISIGCIQNNYGVTVTTHVDRFVYSTTQPAIIAGANPAPQWRFTPPGEGTAPNDFPVEDPWSIWNDYGVKGGDATTLATGSLTASGAATHVGDTSPTATGALTAAGSATHVGDASLTATGSLSAAGAATHVGDVTATATGSLTASGSATHTGDATLTATGSLTATGAATHPGDATLTATGSLTASGAATHVGDASPTATGTLTADGVVPHPATGDAALTATITLTAAGAVVRTGGATLTLTASAAAAGGHLITGAATPTATGALTASTAHTPRAGIFDLHPVSYFPSAHAGSVEMWNHYSGSQSTTDMTLAKSLGFNAVRVVLSPNASSFSFPSPSGPQLANFTDFYSRAQAVGINIHLVLFDLWSQFGHVADSKTWFDAIMGAIPDTDNIAVIELHNEVQFASTATYSSGFDGGWPGGTPHYTQYGQVALVWAQQMIPYARAGAPGVPITISVPVSEPSGHLRTFVNGTKGTSAEPDWYDWHCYFGTNAAMIYRGMHEALLTVGNNPSKLFIGETGATSTATGTLGSGQAQQLQSDFIQASRWAAQYLGLPDPGVWMLLDLSASSQFPSGQTYGLYDTTGATPRKAVSMIQAYPPGSQVPPVTTTGVFAETFLTDTNSNHVPPRIYVYKGNGGAQPIVAALDTTGDGLQKIKLTGSSATLSTDNQPGLEIDPSYPLVVPGTEYTVSARMRANGSFGAPSFAIGWYNYLGGYLASSLSPTLHLTSSFDSYSFSAVAPAGAAIAKVFIRVGHNAGNIWVAWLSWTRPAGAGAFHPVASTPGRIYPPLSVFGRRWNTHAPLSPRRRSE